MALMNPGGGRSRRERGATLTLVTIGTAAVIVTLATVFHEVPNRRAWLFRVASNLWIDRVRRARLDAQVHPEPDAPAIDPRAAREAAGTLLSELSPQERAAVVLKDVLDFSLEEITDALSTSVGAVKAALHRGRGRLATPSEQPARAPSANAGSYVEPSGAISPQPTIPPSVCTATTVESKPAEVRPPDTP